jgi:anaerobic selenocysteine-containing dehydrogenase
MFHAAERGELRAIYAIGENPAQAEADQHRTERLLTGLDHLVVQDIFLTATARLAHVVLPASSSWCEAEGTVTNSERRVQRVRKALEAPGNARDDLWIIAELARRMGQDWGHPSAEERFGLTQDQAAAGPFLFIMFHETAHAIFAILDVPVLGREEDAADQVATLVAIRMGGNFAERMLRGAALMYQRDSTARKIGEDDFADLHGLDRQRYYNVLCMAWGADEKRFAWAQEVGHLPKERAEGCAEEFTQVQKAVRFGEAGELFGCFPVKFFKAHVL